MKCSNGALYNILGAALLGCLVLVGVCATRHIEVPAIVTFIATGALGALTMAARPGDPVPDAAEKMAPPAPSPPPPRPEPDPIQ